MQFQGGSDVNVFSSSLCMCADTSFSMYTFTFCMIKLCASVCPDPDKCASTSLVTWNYKTSFSSTSTHQNCDIKLTVTLEVEKCTCVYLLHFKRVQIKIANVCVISCSNWRWGSITLNMYEQDHQNNESKQPIRNSTVRDAASLIGRTPSSYQKKNCICLQICWFILFLGM